MIRINPFLAVFLSLFLNHEAISSSPRAVMPIGSPGDWITGTDYPAEALKDGLVGIAGFELAIGTDGRVEKCSITASSGSGLLDAATCNLITQRASFTPAVDRHNRPVAGMYRSRVRWVLPNKHTVTQPTLVYTSEITFVVDVDGTVSDCKVLRQSNPPGMPNIDSCAIASRSTSPVTDHTGRSVRKRVTTESTISTEMVTTTTISDP